MSGQRPAKRVGICLVHGWWFELDEQNVVACPEPGCFANVQVYDRIGSVPYLADVSLLDQHPEPGSNDAPSTGPSPPLIRKEESHG